MTRTMLFLCALWMISGEVLLAQDCCGGGLERTELAAAAVQNSNEGGQPTKSGATQRQKGAKVCQIIKGKLICQFACPICPMFPLDENVWVFLADGCDSDGQDGCIIKEATVAVGYFNYPYMDCPEECEDAQGNLKGSLKKGFEGYPPPFVENTHKPTEISFVSPRAERLFKKEAHDKFDYVTAMINGVAKHFLVVKVKLPGTAGYPLPDDAYRLLGYEIKDPPAKGKPGEAIHPAMVAAGGLEHPGFYSARAKDPNMAGIGEPILLILRKR